MLLLLLLSRPLLLLLSFHYYVLYYYYHYYVRYYFSYYSYITYIHILAQMQSAVSVWVPTWEREIFFFFFFIMSEEEREKRVPVFILLLLLLLLFIIILSIMPIFTHLMDKIRSVQRPKWGILQSPERGKERSHHLWCSVLRVRGERERRADEREREKELYIIIFICYCSYIYYRKPVARGDACAWNVRKKECAERARVPKRQESIMIHILIMQESQKRERVKDGSCSAECLLLLYE